MNTAALRERQCYVKCFFSHRGSFLSIGCAKNTRTVRERLFEHCDYLITARVKEAANRIGFGETVAVEGPGSDALNKERLRSMKQACSRTIQTPALSFCARGASPLMRERRINRK